MGSTFRRTLAGFAVLLATCGTSVATASAHLFEAEEYFGTTGVAALATSNFNGFKIAGAVTVCKKGTFESVTPILKAEEKIKVKPTYSECFTEIKNANATTVETKSCEFEFTAAENKTKNGSVSIVKCPSTNPIVVKVAGVESCTIKVSEGSNAGLKENDAGPEAGDDRPFT